MALPCFFGLAGADPARGSETEELVLSSVRCASHTISSYPNPRVTRR